MGKTLVMYSYSEMHIAKFSPQSILPYPVSNPVKKLNLEFYNIFKSAGGVKIIDYYENPSEFTRLTFWKTSDDYNNWLQNPVIQNYIYERDLYHLRNQITYNLKPAVIIEIYE